MSDLQIDFGAHLPGCIPAKPCGVCDVTNHLRFRLGGETSLQTFLDKIRGLNGAGDAVADTEGEVQINLDLTIDATLGSTLSYRARNGLRNDNIFTLRELVSKTEGELLRIPNFGRRSLIEVKELLKDKGLTLGALPLNSP